VRKPEGKRPLGKPKNRLEGKVKIYFGLDGVEYILATWGRGMD
jgi:hypothetical protein